MIELEIDGKPVQVAEGTTVIEAANSLGIYVPHFCYHKKLSVAANCRMCLVEVEKAPKPLPACATPATNGMKVRTHSPLAVDAQKGVMEFLLINHPLDCPVCDEGGECQLQDLAVGYGASASRYQETKRSVPNKFLGSLIATEMTRCIHCTRCVRFGIEIAGMMELGMVGRGEAAEILAFVDRTVDSEISGNMIDVCPVGALTSKPFRFTARPWELSDKKSVSAHCALGSNLLVQTKLNRVYRVLPLENEELNECWLSDKDRFSYEALNSDERLTQPMIRRGGEWRSCDWPQAFNFIASRLREICDEAGGEHIGALATPHQTLEELYLLQKLMRALESGNVDHRLRQSDFSLDGALTGAPWLGMSVAEISQLKRILIIGSNLRKDHPLIAARIRKAAKRGAELALLNPHDDDFALPVAHKAIVAPSMMVAVLEQIVSALEGSRPNDPARAIAAHLSESEPAAVLLGNLAQHHPQFSRLRQLAHKAAQLAGAQFGFFGEAANSVGGYLAQATPFASSPRGMNAMEMLAKPRRAYLLLGVEPELDCHDPRQATTAMRQAELVLALSAYRHRASDYAHVLLPIAPFTETAGTFVNCDGRAQSFKAAVPPLGETRPGWKVLRVLGNTLKLSGFDYDTVEEIRAEIAANGAPLNNAATYSLRSSPFPETAGIERIAEVPIYSADAIVRRSPPLQKTRDAGNPVATMRGSLMRNLGIEEGNTVRLRQNGGEAVAIARRDDRLPDNCVRVAAGHPLTSALGPMFGAISVQRVEK
ncbi:MAG TPA: NADH-quinone oxidoreductase subunit NuoG [Burkholderiales bacterium]|nr:NADH-quinone oxidoreductase subunit NuoG [Burkholderiales bacterium]